MDVVSSVVDSPSKIPPTALLLPDKGFPCAPPSLTDSQHDPLTPLLKKKVPGRTALWARVRTDIPDTSLN